MSLSRRELIQNGLGFVALGTTVPSFLLRAAEASAAETAPANGGGRGKILVMVELSGGNDGLNTVVPFADPLYSKLRPGIGIGEKDSVKIDAKLGLHPNLKELGGLFEKGQLAVVNGVGYPNANRSHFESMDIWQSGDLAAKTERSGWLARYFDAQGHLKENPLSGVTLGSNLPLALWTQNSPVSVIGNGYDFGLGGGILGGGKGAETLRALYNKDPNAGKGTIAANNADFIRNIGHEVYTSTEVIKKAIQGYDGKAGEAARYPNNGFAQGLQTIAKLITGGVETRVYYANLGGFDTHANQPGSHGYLMQTLGDGVAAFFRDLALQHRDKDVMLLTFSEFGRRVRENGSGGTDHGAASVLFAVGGSVKGGIYGNYPSLEDLDDGDLKYTTDFRRVYSTVLDGWLGTRSNDVMGEPFPKLGFV